MADKQLLLKKSADDGFFADDDPLAELARIVGFEPTSEARPQPANNRREPEFNLEDELLKEFEQFEELPHGNHATAVEDDIPAVAFEELTVEEEAGGEPELEPLPVASPQELRAVENEVPAPPAVEAVRPMSHPVFDLEDEIFREFAAFDARRAGPPADIVVPSAHDVPVAEPAVVVEAPEADDHDPAAFDATGEYDLPAAPLANEVNSADELAEAELDIPAVATESDAAEDAENDVFADSWHELNEQICGELVQAGAEEAAEPEAFPVESRGDTEAPLDQDADLPAEPAREPVEDDAALEWDQQPAYDLDAFAEDLASEAVSSEAVSVDDEVVLSSPALSLSEPQAPPVQNAAKADFDIDTLLEDVERYPVVNTGNNWPRQTPVIGGFTPSFTSPSPAEKSQGTPAPQVAEVPQVTEIEDIEIALGLPVSTNDVDEETSVPTDSMAVVMEPFDDNAFELDLSEIELDLLDVETFATDQVARGAITASRQSLSDLSTATVDVAPRAAVEPVRVEQPTVANHKPEDYSSLPFDPSQVATEEDPVEAIAEMDVPEIPVVDHETPAVTQPDYDIDIDAEMAHLFTPTSTPQRATPVRPAAAAPAPAAQASPMLGQDLDEFERALEEDFRKSLTENRTSGHPDRVALSPSAIETADTGRQKGRNMAVLAASVAAIVLLGGAGVYAFMGGDSPILSTTGEPKIILADKEPVKVVPEDKGGQTVPNQDKAVYDRVSGEASESGKQERLLTSNEEPIDVVQKTLMPENMPMDDETAGMGTDTSDTNDPRLLPENADGDNVSSSEKVASGVSPRKVRTMVVRSDGTLVAREEVVPEVANAAVPEADTSPVKRELDKPVAELPERLGAAVDEASSAVTKGLELKPAEQPVAKTEPDPVAEKLAALDEQQPVEAAAEPAAAETTDAGETAAVPEASEDKANQGALAEAANAEVAAPVRVVKTTSFTTDTAPVPENRPVEQPVNVVGTVTDQGNVRSAAEAEQPKEVAVAEPVAQPAETTVVPAGSYVIQIASLPSEADAQRSYNNLSQKFASVIGGRGVDIRKAEIKNKGTYYRVRIPAGSKKEAQALCEQYKQAGGSCLVSK